MTNNIKGVIKPYGFEGEADLEQNFANSLEELFGDFAKSLSVQGTATALVILYSLF